MYKTVDKLTDVRAKEGTEDRETCQKQDRQKDISREVYEISWKAMQTNRQKTRQDRQTNRQISRQVGMKLEGHTNRWTTEREGQADR